MTSEHTVSSSNLDVSLVRKAVGTGIYSSKVDVACILVHTIVARYQVHAVCY